MAKRGRPTKAAKPGTRASLGLKVTADLKAKLEREAERSGRTQSQEAEARLERSFDRQGLLTEALALAYGDAMAARLLVVAQAMQVAGTIAYMGSGHRLDPDRWARDPFSYRQAIVAAMIALWEFRPQGEPVIPEKWSLRNMQPDETGFILGRNLAKSIRDPKDRRPYAVGARELLAAEEEEEA